MVLSFSSFILLLFFSLGDTWRLAIYPVRMIGRVKQYTSALSAELAIAFIRRSAWKYVRTAIIGYLGYPFRQPRISRRPPTKQTYYKIERLPENVVKAAVTGLEEYTRESASIVMRNLSIRSYEELSNALNGGNTTRTLVHSAYYSHPFCVNRMADWLARSTEELDEIQDSRFNDELDRLLKDDDSN